tara:strand:+ start:256 stop:2220 length:1965 start_codon:yes stop_codon:yes gene_type:complete
MAVTDGLFSGASIGEVRQLLNKERDDRIRQAQADNFAMTQNPYAAMIAKSNQQLAEAVTGGARALGQATGLDTGMFAGLGEDPRLSKARKRDKDRKEITAMFQSRKMEKPKDFYEMANEFRRRGYPTQANELIQQGHGFRKQTQEEDRIGIQRTNVVGQLDIGRGQLNLAEQKEQFFQQQDIKRLSITEQESKWKQQERIIQRSFTKRGLDIQSNRNRDLRVIADRESDIRLYLGDKNVGVAQQNANTNAFNAKVNQTYGLREQDRKEKGQAATIRQADAALALKEQLGLKGIDIQQQTVDVAKRNAAVAEDKAKFAKYLGIREQDYKEMSTDRLYSMSRDKMEFDQNLAERGMTVREALSEHTIELDGRKFDHTVLDAKAQRDLAQDMFEFKKEMGYKSDSREDRLFALQKKAKEFGMDIQLRKANFTEESFAIQEARLQKRMAMEKYFKQAGIDQRNRELTINQELRREGYDIERLNLKQKEEQFVRKLFQDRMLGLKNLSLDEQRLKLQTDIAADDVRLREQGIDIKQMEVKDLKDYRLASLEIKEKQLVLDDKIATLKANTPTPRNQKTFNTNDTNVLTKILDKSENWEKVRSKFPDDKFDPNSETIVAISDALSGIMASDEEMNIQEAFEIYANQKAEGEGGDAFSGVQ